MPATDGQRAAAGNGGNSEVLATMLDAQRRIAACASDERSVMDEIARSARAITGAEGAVVERLEAEQLVCRAASGVGSRHLGLRVNRRDSLSGRCIDGGAALRCDDARRDDRVDQEVCERLGLRSMLVVPLITEGEPIGVLKVLSSQASAFDDRDLAMLELIAQAMLGALASAAQLESNRRLLGELRGALDAQRDSEQRFTHAFEHAPIGMALVSPEGHFIQVNRALCELVGYREAELLKRSFQDITHAEDLDLDLGYVQKMLDGEIDSYRMEKRYLHADGHEVWVQLSVSLVRDERGAPRYFVSQIQAIGERKRAEAELRRREADLRAVGTVTRTIAGGADARETICEAAHELTGSSFACLFEPGDWRHLRLSAADGIELPASTSIRIGEEPSGAAMAYASGQPLFIAEAEGSSAVSQRLVEQTGARSVLFQPVTASDEVVAVIVVAWRERVEGLSSREATVIGLLADEAAVAFEREDLVGRLAAMARTDPLTGLANRRAWDEQLHHSVAFARRAGHPLALVMLDVDHLKRLNDSEGHQAGDRALKEVTAAWRSCLRESDTLARIGGDEFSLILPDCDLANAQALIARLRRAGARAGIPASGGCAEWDRSEEIEELIRRADASLYAVKAARED